MFGYREFVFEGSLPVVKAFLLGLQAGRRWRGGIRFCEECSVAGESRGHKMLEKLGLEKDKTHVLVAKKHAEAVTAAVREHGKALGLALRADRKIKGAAFEYEFAIYQKATATRIKKLLNALPAALEQIDEVEKEEERPEAKGAEMYAPEHDYVYSGRGEIGTQRDLDALLDFREKLDKKPAFEVSEVRLFDR